MSKDYVTIKIPRETRDQARDDPRTYEAIMEAGLGEDVGDLDPYGGEVPNTSEVDTDELVDAVVAALDGMEIETKTDKAMAEDIAREVCQKADYAEGMNTDRLYARLEELETNLKNEIEALQGGRV